MKKSWSKIDRMIRSGDYVHRKGFRLSEVLPPFIIDQAKNEMQELIDAPDDPEEMADLFGVLIHYCIKQGWSMDLIESYLSEKLDLRFSKESCKHEHLNMDGICHSCGADCRGSH